MSFSPAALHHYLPAPNQGVWWVALSGGLDSCVLLHALATLKLPVELRALHINHQISPNANSWQQTCAEFCAQLGVPFIAEKVTVTNSGRGIEDAARAARYGVFEHYLQPGDLLFTGHHADDQAETLLLRLLRGTGPRGLAAMARVRSLGQGLLYRPLLDFTRAALEVYAVSAGLSWVTDESNAEDHYDRNYLRNQVIPLLRERWPTFASKWQQTAELCAANEESLNEQANQDLTAVRPQREVIGESISLGYLRDLSAARRHNLLRHWLRGQGASIPEQQHLTQIEQQLINGRQDAEAEVRFGELSLRAFRDRLYALPMRQLPVPALGVFPFNIEQQYLNLATGARFECCWCDSATKPLLRAGLPDLHIRFRQGGERCRPVGRAHSQTLKRLLQEYGVAPWLRETLPLIYSGDQLVAVADLWICEGYQAESAGYGLAYQAAVGMTPS